MLARADAGRSLQSRTNQPLSSELLGPVMPGSHMFGPSSRKAVERPFEYVTNNDDDDLHSLAAKHSAEILLLRLLQTSTPVRGYAANAYLVPYTCTRIYACASRSEDYGRSPGRGAEAARQGSALSPRLESDNVHAVAFSLVLACGRKWINLPFSEPEYPCDQQSTSDPLLMYCRDPDPLTKVDSPYLHGLRSR
ncbi:hypothetical protein BD309DRAFT_967517 [Dichomitus squalens]|uniref:Uncharacterized protein n=1 Tax=Dichomitus squalens TaxID=114155 RepID=A0A4Q9NIY8_9APHY|nr:hypothetical protein BD309DRAFT_967517 [Dichomitus squalens]TBU52651.1 hypothetical protein BD310DRAFT_939794 [Dichomitus squalens]